MKVTIHKLFDYLLETAGAEPPECFLGFSLSTPPTLADFLPDLDPALPLDWNGVSFQGLPALRQRVIDQAGLAGTCTADDVLITAGAAEANYLIFRQLLSAGDEVVTDAPGWPQAGVMARAIGARLVEVPRDEGRAWALDPDAVIAALTPRTKLVFLTNPNNPTGRLIPETDLRALPKPATRRGSGFWWTRFMRASNGRGRARPRLRGCVRGASPRGRCPRRWGCRGCGPGG